MSIESVRVFFRASPPDIEIVCVSASGRDPTHKPLQDADSACFISPLRGVPIGADRDPAER
jgi:hypothetical protein